MFNLSRKKTWAQGETMTIFLAIHEDSQQTVYVEYIPAQDGTIEIVSVDVQRLPHTWAEQRAAYQAAPSRPKPPRQLGMFDGEK
jgi:hypothetical protein